MIEGWCIPHGADIVLDGDRWCPEHNTLVIPPSWADHTSVWPEWPPRPAGYVYVAKQLQTPVRASQRPLATSRKPAPRKAQTEISASLDAKLRPESVVDPATKRKPFSPAPADQTLPARQRVRQQRLIRCEHCGDEKSFASHGGPPQRFCSTGCRTAARTRRVQVRREADRQTRRPCPVCRAEFTPYKRGGPVQVYCSARCRALQNVRTRTSQPMAATGRACVDCGRGDRPHKARGRCQPCSKRAARKTQQEVAA